MLEIRYSKLGDSLGVAVEGIDLRQPMSPELVNRLHQAQLEHLVVCIRGQQIEAREFADAMSCFGDSVLDQPAPLHADVPAVKIFSSDDTKILPDGTRVVFGPIWHTDGAYLPAPCSLTALYGIKVPAVGGDTQFCNLYAAYDTLPQATKQRIDGAKVVHNIASGRNQAIPRPPEVQAALAQKYPPVVHPLVRTHPETGRKSLYLCGERMERIVDMDADESEELLLQLLDHATQPQFQYRHKWRHGDILIWDNRCTIHKANGDYPVGETRYLYRITLHGTPTF
jgi:taurine dioxygenase